MAVDPRIALMGEVPDIGQTFSNALLNVQRIDQIQRQREEAPLRERLLAAQTGAAEAVVPTAQAQFNVEKANKIKSIATAARQIIPDLQAGNIDRVVGTLQQRAQNLQQAGISDTDTQEGIALAQTNPAELLRISQQAVALDTQLGKGAVQFGAQQTFKDPAGNLFFGTTRRSPTTGQVESVIAPVGGGTQQPTGRLSLVSGLGQTAAEKQQAIVETAGLVEEAKLGKKLAAEPAIEEKKELAKLKAQRKLLPKVQSAVADSVARAKQAANIAVEARSNQAALNVYEVATGGLVESLKETVTGPIVGFLPAVTASQQIADGSVAAMAPILKQMFRASGEGTFTDQDQKLLLDMIPTRKDRPAARQAKIKNIDAIVRAKLTTQPQVLPPQPGQQIQPAAAPQRIRFDAQGNIIQ